MSFESEVSRVRAERDKRQRASRRTSEERSRREREVADEWRGGLVSTLRRVGLERVPVFTVVASENDDAAKRSSTTYAKRGDAWVLRLVRDYHKHDNESWNIFLTEENCWLAGLYRSNEEWHAVQVPSGKGLGLYETWQRRVTGLPDEGGWTVWSEDDRQLGLREAVTVIAAMLQQGDFTGPDEHGIYRFTE